MMHTFLEWKVPPLAIVADKAYGSRKIRQQIEDEGALAIITSKATSENLFNTTRHFMLTATWSNGSSAR